MWWMRLICIFDHKFAYSRIVLPQKCSNSIPCSNFHKKDNQFIRLTCLLTYVPKTSEWYPLICIFDYWFAYLWILHTSSFLQNILILFIDLCLINRTCQLVILPAWLQIPLRKWLSSGAKVTFWWPFCLCKLDGQELKIPLGNRVFQIQHTQIRLKSLVPNFYSKLPLEPYRAPFFRNSTRLFVFGIFTNMNI